MSEEQIQKLAEKRYGNSSYLFAQQRDGFIEGYKAALQNKVSDVSAEEQGMDEAFPLKNILQRLVKASEYLLHRKNYDGNDYEEIEACIKRANEIIKNLEYASILNERKDNMYDKYFDEYKVIEREYNILDDSDLHILKQIRNYFGENDGPILNHTAYSVIDKIIKKAPLNESKDNVGVNDAIEFKDWCDKNTWEYEMRDETHYTTKELYEIFRQSQPQQKEV